MSESERKRRGPIGWLVERVNFIKSDPILIIPLVLALLLAFHCRYVILSQFEF